MKTRQDWLDVWAESPDIIIGDLVELVQQDALKRASEIADDYDGKGLDSTGYNDQTGSGAITRSDISKAILAEMERVKG